MKITSLVQGMWLVAVGMCWCISAVAGPEVMTLSASDLEGKPMLPVQAEGEMLKLLSKEPASYVAVSKFASTDGHLDASVKRYEKITLALRDWPMDEFFYLLSGQVEITDAQGRTKTFSKSDAFVLPKGFTGTWRQLSTVDMITVEYSVAD